MSYQRWFHSHGLKHQAIVAKLKARGLNKEEIVNYFDFSNMVESEPAFCPLYSQNKKCHDVEHLNCYLCACPLFRFNSNGIRPEGDKTVYSVCHVNAKRGKPGVFGSAIHQDCTQCTVPHHKNYVSRNYHEDWFLVMKRCDLEKNDKDPADKSGAK